jgi:hypothetical protein
MIQMALIRQGRREALISHFSAPCGARLHADLNIRRRSALSGTFGR